jgi:hypothetical protein
LLTSASGNITDGSGANNYENSSNCAWIIAPSVGARGITLNFTEFETEKSTDWVRVYQCTSSDCLQKDEVAAFSGPKLPSQVARISTGYMLVHFTSDSGHTAAGFTASWTLTPLETTSTAEAAGGSVGAALFMILFVAVVVVFFIHRRRRRGRMHPGKGGPLHCVSSIIIRIQYACILTRYFIV